jgi:phage gp29-like protein
MSLLDQFAAWLGFARAPMTDQPGAMPPGPIPETGHDLATSAPPLVLSPEALTFEAARFILLEHERGLCNMSAALSRTALRDPVIRGAMNQRLLALLGRDHVIESAADHGRGDRYARDLSERFRSMVPRAAEADMIRDGIMLGMACGQNEWWYHDTWGELMPVLVPWPTDYLDHNPWLNKWYVNSREGRIEITPGDGRWVLYTPWSPRSPYFHGVITTVADSYLRAKNAARDYSRFVEVQGQGILKVGVPSGSRGTPEYQNMMSSLRNMGRAPVVPLPKGKTPEESYSLDLEALAADVSKIFTEMIRLTSGNFRLAILGQDLTSQNSKVGTNASSQTGMKVSQLVSAADSETWAECLHKQVITPWATYRGRPDLAPWAYYETEEDEDAQAEAQAANAAADALAKWRDLMAPAGRELDVVSAAERWGVPLLPVGETSKDRAVRRLVLRSKGWRRVA